MRISVEMQLNGRWPFICKLHMYRAIGNHEVGMFITNAQFAAAEAAQACEAADAGMAHGQT